MDKITTGKIKKFFKGKGFAGALCLSVVAIGISTYLTYDSTLKTIADEEPQKPDSTGSAEQVRESMDRLKKEGKYEVSKEAFAKADMEMMGGWASPEDMAHAMSEVY